MKGFAFFVVAFALVALPYAYQFTHAKHTCQYAVKITEKSMTASNTYQISVYDWYVRYQAKNVQGNIMIDEIYRPDVTNVHKTGTYTVKSVVKFSNNRFYIQETDFADFDKYKADFAETFAGVDMFGTPMKTLFKGASFTNMDTGRIPESKDLTFNIYYNNDTNTRKGGRHPRDYWAMYVSKDNFIKYIVRDNDVPGLRTVYQFEYLVYPKVALLDSFKFDDKWVMNCTHDAQIKKAPTEVLNKQCNGASVTKVIVSLVAASILSALLVF